MAINKVVYHGDVLIDLTMLTVTPETLAEGTVAINAAGELIVGTAKVYKDGLILGASELGSTIL